MKRRLGNLERQLFAYAQLRNLRELRTYDWSRYNSLPRAFVWIKSELVAGRVSSEELVRAKLTVPGNEPVDVSGGWLESLRLQVDTELKPVLRARDFAEFDLERAFEKVVDVAVAFDR